MVEFVKARDGRFWRKDVFESFVIVEKNGARFVVASFPDHNMDKCDFRYEDWFARRRPQRVEVVGHVGTHRVPEYEY